MNCPQRRVLRNVKLSNLENVLQRNLRTDRARECIFRTSGGAQILKTYPVDVNHGGVVVGSMYVMVCPKRLCIFLTVLPKYVHIGWRFEGTLKSSISFTLLKLTLMYLMHLILSCLSVFKRSLPSANQNTVCSTKTRCSI